MLGRVILAEPSRPSHWGFNIGLARLREIEAVVLHRHGDMIPETDDAFLYVEAVVLTLTGQDPVAWCRRWAPWAVAGDGVAAAVAAAIEESAARASTRTTMITADECAALLAVTMAERTALGLKTIGASDVTPDERKAMAREIKRERDRLRAEQKRKAGGMKDRESYVAGSAESNQPWIAMGMSRRTWYRKGKPAFGTSPSPILYNRTREQPVPKSPSVAMIPHANTVPKGAAGGRGGPAAPRILSSESSKVDVDAA